MEAHRRARKGKGYYQEVKYVDSHLEECIHNIQEMLLNKTYKVGKYTEQYIKDKGKVRRLMKLPYYPDRIIQWAIMLQIENDFNTTFCYSTCASIKLRGINRAFKLTKRYLKDDPEGTKYCLKLDIKKFYDNIDPAILKQLLARKFKDPDLLDILYNIIDSIPDEKGIPIGSYLSQYFANFYLAYFDHWIKEELHVKYYIRYMDDMVLLSSSKEQLWDWFNKINAYVTEKLNLTIKKNYQVFPVDSRSVDFVGYKFFHHKILLRQRTAKMLKQKMRDIVKERIMNKHNFHTIYSYYGMTKFKGNCWGLYTKYIYPLLAVTYYYHARVIKKLNIPVPETEERLCAMLV